MFTHLKPDILECEVKWALGSIIGNKISVGDAIPGDLFQILKDDAAKVLHSLCQHIWKTQWWPQDWKTSVFILFPKKGNVKECSNCCTIALISHTSKVMPSIFQARLQQFINREFPDIKVGFRKGRKNRDQIANIHWITRKARELQKISISALMTTPKPLYGSQQTMGNSSRDFLDGSDGKVSVCNAGDHLQHRRPGLDPWVGKIPWRRKWQPTPVFLPGKCHGQRSLAGYSPRGHKELDRPE